MLPRLLVVLCALFLGQASFSQQSGTANPTDVPANCPVTTASGPSFVPPWPYPSASSPQRFWYGTDRLWVSLPAEGTWRGLGHDTPDDPTFRQKMQWWRRGYEWRTEPNPNLKITGKRLDSPAPPLKARVTNVIGPPPSMMVGMNLPTLGCWEITGRYESDELTFVIWVAR